MDSKLRCVFEMPVENEKMVRPLIMVSAFHVFVHLRLTFIEILMTVQQHSIVASNRQTAFRHSYMH